MTPKSTALVTQSTTTAHHQLDPSQTLRASTALLRKLESARTGKTSANKTSLLADADTEDVTEEVPLWLILTTKKHIVDKKRLKPGKIALPHPYLDTQATGEAALRICLITADPQRKYKDLVAHPTFPVELSSKITRVLGLEKLKSKYKSYEVRRQLLGEYDIFLADDRVITYLPTMLGKIFYKSSSKRPIPVSLEGKRQNFDETGNKRQKLSAGGKKVVKTEPKPTDTAYEIVKTLNSALVHLAPSTTTAVKVGIASQTPEQIQANVEAVVQGLATKFVPQQWKNIRSIHIKGPETAALPIWLAEELWTDEADVLEEMPQMQVGKKRKRSALTAGVDPPPEEILVPGPDGKMRKLIKPVADSGAVKASKGKRKSGEAQSEAVAEKVVKKRKSEAAEEAGAKAAEKAEKAEKQARKEALRKQKEKARGAVNGHAKVERQSTSNAEGVMKVKKSRVKAAGGT